MHLPNVIHALFNFLRAMKLASHDNIRFQGTLRSRIYAYVVIHVELIGSSTRFSAIRSVVLVIRRSQLRERGLFIINLTMKKVCSVNYQEKKVFMTLGELYCSF